jgi:hypothetical protein
MMKTKGNLKCHFTKGAACLGMLLFAWASVARADLDEAQFQSYIEGDLCGQKNWSSRGFDGHEDIEERDRVLVKLDDKTKKYNIEWREGYEGKNQTRLIKRFPDTVAPQVVVTFGFLPGDESMGGGLYFEQTDVGGVALQFRSGTIRVLEPGKREGTDTGIPFKPQEWNRFEARLDFEKHEVEVFLGGVSIGRYALPPSLTALNQLNLYAGGVGFASAMDDLRIESAQ